jgi:pyruvate/oxaloacetate carboxyltransferase
MVPDYKPAAPVAPAKKDAAPQPVAPAPEQPKTEAKPVSLDAGIDAGFDSGYIPAVSVDAGYSTGFFDICVADMSKKYSTEAAKTICKTLQEVEEKQKVEEKKPESKVEQKPEVKPAEQKPAAAEKKSGQRVGEAKKNKK